MKLWIHIGQRFQTSGGMKEQRDRCTMQMGPILQSIVGEDTVALVYDMYLMPKGMEDKVTFTMTVTEFNHFGIVDGKRFRGISV